MKKSPLPLLMGFFILPLLLVASKAAERKEPDVKVDVDLVLVSAAVTDDEGRSVTGLDKTRFQLWEDHVQQDIQYLSTTELPVSLTIVLDVSSSVADKLPLSRDAIVTLLKMGNPQDEYALVEFNNRPELTQDFEAGTSTLQSRLASASAAGSTALYDAVYVGLETLRHARNPRKVLLLVTDGEDNHSRYSFMDIKQSAMESDVQLFAIQIGGYTNPTQTKGHKAGGAVLEELADSTGGEVFSASGAQKLDDICANISEILRNEYVIGYISSNRNKDGKWRSLKLKVSTPSHVSVHARSGYYAPVG